MRILRVLALPVFLVLSLGALALAPAPVSAAERVALVIGNGDYTHAGTLENPVKDSRALSQRLTAAGYEVTVVEDGGIQKLYSGLREFCGKANQAEVALFFFAGHGIEAKGKNYLLPVDAELAHEDDLDLQTLALKRVLDDIGDTGAVLKVIVLDCCRNNPLARTRGWMKQSRSLSGGLAEVDDKQLAAGTMVVFSGEPGREVPDGVGQPHSPFAQALLKQMESPGTSLAEVFVGVAREMTESEPWIQFDGRGKSLGAFSKVPMIPGTAPAGAVKMVEVKDDAAAEIAALKAQLAAMPKDQSSEVAELKARLAEALKPKASKTPQSKPAVVMTPPAFPATPASTPIRPPTQPVSSGDGSLASGAIGDSRSFDIGGGQKVVLKYVPGGEFLMGSPKDEEGRWYREENQVRVTLSSHFWIGETEVTQGVWKAVMGTSPAQQKAKGDCYDDVHGAGAAQPMYFVSWQDAQDFVGKLNAKAALAPGWKWSLPSEAQWERACRGGTETAYSFGNDGGQMYKHGNFADKNFTGHSFGDKVQDDGYGNTTAPVKSYPANAYGLHDMHGNVEEWCLDSGESETELPGGVDPLGATGSKRAYRGGSWVDAPCRSANRDFGTPVGRFHHIGMRVVAVPVER